MYAMVGTRPDISHAVGVVSKYLANQGNEHWNVVKWIFGYLNGLKITFVLWGLKCSVGRIYKCGYGR